MLEFTTSPNGRTKRQHIIDDLVDAIEAEQLRPGDKLPTQDELQETYGYSRSTVLKAQDWLRARGLIESEQGPRGTHVTADVLTKLPDALEELRKIRGFKKPAERSAEVELGQPLVRYTALDEPLAGRTRAAIYPGLEGAVRLRAGRDGTCPDPRNLVIDLIHPDQRIETHPLFSTIFVFQPSPPTGG